MAYSFAKAFNVSFEWIKGTSDFRNDRERIRSIVQSKRDVDTLIAEIIAIHGYVVDIDTVAYSGKEVPFIEAPNGNRRYWDNVETMTKEFSNLYAAIDDYIEFSCSQLTKKLFDDYKYRK